MQALLERKRPSTNTNTTLEQAEQVATWQDWVIYLKAQLTLLDVQQIEADPRRTSAEAFELAADTPETRRAEAATQLKRIPSARRTLFDKTRDARRNIVQRELEDAQRTSSGRHRVMLDADVVDRATYEQLLSEAEGTTTGWGQFPYGDSLRQVEVAKVLNRPAADEYGITQDSDAAMKRRNVILIIAILLATPLLMYMVTPRSAVSRAALLQLPVKVNDVTPALWQVTAATGIDTNGAVTRYPLAAQNGTRWPRIRGTEPTGRWHNQTAYPMEVCLPAQAIETLATLRLHGGVDIPDRTYTISAAAPAQPDLLVAACGAASGTWARYGTIKEVTPLATQALNTLVTLSEGQDITLKVVRVIGQGEEPDVPANNYRVRLQITGPKDLDWSTLNATLTTQNGNEVYHQAPRQEGDTTELEYLVPAFTAPIDAAWTVTAPGAKQSLRWRLHLETPPTHEALIRQFLQVSAVGLQPSTSGNSALMQFTLRNTGLEPLHLMQNDLQVQQNTVRVQLPMVSELDEPLAAQEERTVSVKIEGLRPDLEAMLTIGKDRFRIDMQ